MVMAQYTEIQLAAGMLVSPMNYDVTRNAKGYADEVIIVLALEPMTP